MRLRVMGCVLAIMLVWASNGLAQQGTTEIRGRVVDAQGASIPGASVTVRNQDTGMFRETFSGDDGTYFVSALAPGKYQVSVELQGFKKQVLSDVVLEVGKTATMEVQLAVGGIEESVTVSAESQLVDTTSKEIGGNISARELVSLPSINRNFVGLIGVLPGIVPNVSTDSVGSDAIITNGRESRNNNYLVDGANNFDDVNGGRSGTQARTALESIQEFQVLTNQFDAEYGRTSGAVVNAVTKQGTNAWHGVGFVFAQDKSLTENEYFAKKRGLDKPDTKRQEFGGTLGGPIVRNKAHFFGSVERVIMDEGITTNILSRPELNWTGTERTRIWNTVARFDHQVNANNTWGVRWLREYSPQFNQIIGSLTPAAVDEEDDLDQTVVGTLSTVLGNTRVNTLKVNWTQEDVAFANPCYNQNGRRQDQCDPTLVFQTFTDQQSPRAQARINDAYQIDNTFSWFVPGWKGDHDFKFGAQYQYSTIQNSNDGTLNGQFTFGQNDLAFNASNPRTYPDRFAIRVGGPLSSYQKVHFIGAFAQDKWKVTNNLTLSLGLRWDTEVMPIDEVDNPYFDDRNAYPLDLDNFQPRVGFAYTLGESGRQVVRGGYGKFYERTYFELVGGFYTGGTFVFSQTRNFPTNNADLGPRNGNFPTHPYLVNGPVITDATRADLAAQFPVGSRFQNTGATWDHPDRKVPSAHQVSVGYERQVGSDISVSADYVRNMGRELLFTRELNPTLRATPVTAQSASVRQGSADLTAAQNELRASNPAFVTNFSTGVSIPLNVGETDYNAVMVALEKRYRSNYSARVSYTWSDSEGNFSGTGIGTSAFQVLDNLNLDLNRRPLEQDRTHNLVISGTAIVPRTGGLTVSGIARYLTGLPFNLTNNDIDPDRNGTQAEPIAAGTYRGNAAEDAYEVDFDGTYFGARGPNYFKLDMRIGYRIPLGNGRSLDVFGDIFNVTNRANFATPSGNMAVSNIGNFLNLTDTLQGNSNPRLLQLGARFAF
jgi:Carboxypeptidase regulatory-like domain/TonB dependent receptor